MTSLAHEHALSTPQDPSVTERLTAQAFRRRQEILAAMRVGISAHQHADMALPEAQRVQSAIEAFVLALPSGLLTEQLCSDLTGLRLQRATKARW